MRDGLTSVAIAPDVPVLHADADFGVLAHHRPLRLDAAGVPARSPTA